MTWQHSRRWSKRIGSKHSIPHSLATADASIVLPQPASQQRRITNQPTHEVVHTSLNGRHHIVSSIHLKGNGNPGTETDAYQAARRGAGPTAASAAPARTASRIYTRNGTGGSSQGHDKKQQDRGRNSGRGSNPRQPRQQSLRTVKRATQRSRQDSGTQSVDETEGSHRAGSSSVSFSVARTSCRPPMSPHEVDEACMCAKEIGIKVDTGAGA